MTCIHKFKEIVNTHSSNKESYIVEWCNNCGTCRIIKNNPNLDVAESVLKFIPKDNHTYVEQDLLKKYSFDPTGEYVILKQ